METTEPRPILVMADDLRLRKQCRLQLEAAGYRVLTAPSGRDALDLFKSCNPTLLLLDRNLPVLTGWEAQAELRALDRGIPVIVFSPEAETDPEPTRPAAAACLTKPVSRQALVGTVRQFTP